MPSPSQALASAAGAGAGGSSAGGGKGGGNTRRRGKNVGTTRFAPGDELSKPVLVLDLLDEYTTLQQGGGLGVGWRSRWALGKSKMWKQALGVAYAY
jgi:hypothetical protein